MTKEIALKILELSPTEIPNEASIKKKYRQMALKYHPDKNKDADAVEKFQKIHEAYEFLLCEKPDFNYSTILSSFLSNVFTEDVQAKLMTTIIHKLMNLCNKSALFFIRKIDKEILGKIFIIIESNKDILNISDTLLENIRSILEEKKKNDKHTTLHPLIDDLFDCNLYRLVLNNEDYIVPLWHHHLVFDIDSGNLYVDCIPILPDNVSIDTKNNILVNVKYSLQEIWNLDELIVLIGKQQINISRSELKMVHKQTIVLDKRGIPRVNYDNLFDVSRKGNILIEIEISNT
tara:strand:- start:91 stop:960 length:870 start_codon:yes stop_codon:yes gene_type:complete